MTIPTTAWSETSPAGSDPIAQGDDRIREFKTQVREVIDNDHQMNSSGSDADNGKHKRCSFLEQADLGSGATGKTILGGQTIGGKPELVYTDEDDNDIQITDNGVINGDALLSGGDFASANVKLAVLNAIYPVGSIYTNATNATNPATLLGVGTWTAFGAGRVMVGLNSGDTDFDTAGETGGAKTHTLTVDEMPSHTHSYSRTNFSPSSGSSSGGDGTQTVTNTTTGSTGGDQAHNNIQPYVVVYLWRRDS